MSKPKITYKERIIIEEMLKENYTMTAIAKKIGVSNVAISHEINRCGCNRQTYTADHAQKTLGI